MAHRILGIDLGARSVKVIVASPGFRQATITDFFEKPVPAGDEPYEVRAARVVAELVRQYKLDGETPYAAATGDKLFIHILEFPFKSLRRQDLEKAVGAELEGILPLDLEDIVFGFEALPDDLGAQPAPEAQSAQIIVDSAQAVQAAPTGAGDPAWAQHQGLAPGRGTSDSEPTRVHHRRAAAGVTQHGRVAPPAEGMRILACAMELKSARQIIDVLDQHGVEPRGLVAAPASYVRVIERLGRFAGASGAAAGASGSRSKSAAPASAAVMDIPVAVIDIGHMRTDVCVVAGGRAVYARTIGRGGHHVTEVISRVWHIPYQEAERAKHADAYIASAAEPPQSEQWERIHEVVVQEIGALAKELKRTLMSCRAKTGASVGQVLLCGGGSRIRGLATYLKEHLHIPVSTLDAADTESILGPKLASMGVSADIACLAAGVALEGASGRPHFDLRQGELAFKADLSYLRQRMVPVVAALLVVIAFASINAYAALYKLRKAERNLDQRLALETTEVFGTALSAAGTLDRTGGKTGKQKSPLPRMTAYDVLLEINDKMPGREDVGLDVVDLDIRAGKINMKATARSNAEIDRIEETLKGIKCFDEVSRGDTSVGPNDVREFSFTIKMSCMQGASASSRGE